MLSSSSLYRILRQKATTVADVLNLVPLNVSLRRDLVAPWFELVLKVAAISLNNDEDIFKWKLHKGNFIVRSMYSVLV